MAGRQSRGRQRIPLRLIENQEDLYATFSKRRRGLYKKFSELSTLCNADVGLIIFSPTNKPFSFWHPTLESVVGTLRNPHQPLDDHARFVEANVRSTIQHCNMWLDEVIKEKQTLKEQDKILEQIDMTREKGWWEQTSVESLNLDQVKEWKAVFEDYFSKVKSRIEEVRNGGSSSMVLQQQMIGPSNPPPMEMPVWPSNQFHDQYNNALAHEIPNIGGVVSHDHVLGQDQHPLYLSPEDRLPLIGDGGAGGNDFVQFPAQLDYFSPQAQTSGGNGAGPSTGHGSVGVPSTSVLDIEPSGRVGTGEAGPSNGRDINP